MIKRVSRLLWGVPRLGVGGKLLPLEGLVIFKARLKGGLFRRGPVELELEREASLLLCPWPEGRSGKEGVRGDSAPEGGQKRESGTRRESALKKDGSGSGTEKEEQ